jgi:hypothetical protein
LAVTIRGQDERAIVRPKRRVQAEIHPVLARVVVSVQPKNATPQRR